MRKLLAFLTALTMMLTPFAALAETYSLSILWQGEAAGIEAWLRAVGVSEADAAQLAPACADLMNVLEIDIAQDAEGNQTQFEVKLGDWSALSAGVSGDENGLLLQIDQLPGVALRMREQNDTLTMLTAAGKIESILEAWIDSCEITAEQGYFVADTYTCTSRVIERITDRDAAELVTDVLAAVLETCGLTVEREVIAAVVSPFLSGDGCCTLIVGMNGETDIAGFSLTLTAEGEDYVTISAAADEETIVIAAAYAKPDGVRYAVLRMEMTQDELTGSFRLYRTDSYLGLAGAEQTGEVEISAALSMKVSDDDIVMNFEAVLPTGTIGAVHTLTMPADDEVMLWTVVTVGDEKQTAWSCTVELSVTDEAMEELPAPETVIDLRDEQSVDQLLAALPGFSANLINWGAELVIHMPESVMVLLLR